MNGRELIAARVAKEFRDGDYVNLGIGLPTMVANFIPQDIHVTMHAENGILGVGPTPDCDNEDDDCTDAGGNFVTALSGAAFIDSALSFAVIRGAHLDITVLGALEVDQEGNLASWMVPGKRVNGMGGAMDLVVGAKKVIIAMEHVNKDGAPKILHKCKLPLTAVNEVDLIVTDMAVIEVVHGKGLLLKEIAPGKTIEDVKRATGADLMLASNVKVMMDMKN